MMGAALPVLVLAFLTLTWAVDGRGPRVSHRHYARTVDGHTLAVLLVLLVYFAGAIVRFALR